jgi:hypothetical protein
MGIAGSQSNPLPFSVWVRMIGVEAVTVERILTTYKRILTTWWRR